MSHKSTTTSTLSTVVAVGGLIVLVIIVLWGLINLLTLSRGWFSSLFERVERIEVSAPMEFTSGASSLVTWKHELRKEGTYALLYACREGLTFSASVGGQFTSIECGSAFTLGLPGQGGATSSVALLPALEGEESAAVTLTVVFVPRSGDPKDGAQGSATAVVVPASSVAPAPVSPDNGGVRGRPFIGGSPSLSVRVVSAQVDAYGNATVSFDIANEGSGASGVYYFTASLPTQGGYAYTSPAQSPLPAGSHILSTLNFTLALPGTFTVTLSGGGDSSAADNTASVFISTPPQQTTGGPIYTPGPQPYYQPYYGAGAGQCFWNGATYVCNQPSSYSNGQPHYINSGQ